MATEISNPAIAASLTSGTSGKAKNGFENAMPESNYSAANTATEPGAFDMQNLKDKFSDIQGKARDGIRQVADQVDPFIRERPYLAMGAAALAGFLLSSVLLPRRSNR